MMNLIHLSVLDHLVIQDIILTQVWTLIKDPVSPLCILAVYKLTVHRVFNFNPWGFYCKARIATDIKERPARSTTHL